MHKPAPCLPTRLLVVLLALACITGSQSDDVLTGTAANGAATESDVHVLTVGPAVVNTSGVTQPAPTNQPADHPNISLVLQSIKLYSELVDNLDALVVVDCEDDKGYVYSNVSFPVVTADTRQPGYAKFTLSEQVGYIVYGGRFSCRIDVVYTTPPPESIRQTDSLIYWGDTSCWFNYAMYDNYDSSFSQAWSCTVPTGSYTLACDGCDARGSVLPAKRTSSNFWSSVQLRYIIITIACALFVSVIVMAVAGYYTRRRQLRMRREAALARQGMAEDMAPDTNVKPPLFMEARSVSLGPPTKRPLGPVVILNYGSMSTPTDKFHKGTYYLGTPEAFIREDGSPAAPDGGRKRLSGDLALKMATMHQDSVPQAWVVKVNDAGDIQGVEIVNMAPHGHEGPTIWPRHPGSGLIARGTESERFYDVQLTPIHSDTAARAASPFTCEPGALDVTPDIPGTSSDDAECSNIAPIAPSGTASRESRMRRMSASGDAATSPTSHAIDSDTPTSELPTASASQDT